MKLKGHARTLESRSPLISPMPVKTIHLICLHLVTQAQATSLTASVDVTLGQEVCKHVSVLPGSRTLEVRLPYASRETTLAAAQRLSLEQRRLVSAHLSVNAAWTRLSAPGIRTDHTHLVQVMGPSRKVSQALQQHAPLWAGVTLHVQPQVNISWVVLPRETPPEQVQRLADWLSAEVGAAQAALNVPGTWLANGSRHHEVVRYQHGVRVPDVPTHLWTD